MMNKRLNVLVVHEGKRDDYQVVKAFCEAGHSVTLATSAYTSSLAKGLSRITSLRIFSKLSQREAENFPPARVYSATLVEITLRALSKILGDSRTQEWLDYWVSRLAIKASRGTEFDVVISYNYNAFAVFRQLPRGPLRVIFQCHPHPHTVRRILSAAMSVGDVPPNCAEREITYSDNYLARIYSEPLLADHHICASTFTAMSLQEIGIPLRDIAIIPYGCNDGFSFSESEDRPPECLNLIFVGQFVYRKGLAAISRILARLTTRVHISFVGRGLAEIDPSQFATPPNVSISVDWDVSLTQLQQMYMKSHALLFPSLVEGFGHVVLESMRTGCIPIVSSATCAPDLIEPGIDGFVFDANDVEAFVKAIDGLDRHRVSTIRNAVASKASRYTWKRFRQRTVDSVVQAIANIDVQAVGASTK